MGTCSTSGDIYHRAFYGGYMFYKDTETLYVPRPVSYKMDFFEPIKEHEGRQDPRVCMVFDLQQIIAEGKLLVPRSVKVVIEDKKGRIGGTDAMRHFDFQLLLGEKELWRAGSYLLRAERDGVTLWTKQVEFPGYEKLEMQPIEGEGPMRMLVRPDDETVEALKRLEQYNTHLHDELVHITVMLDCACDVPM